MEELKLFGLRISLLLYQTRKLAKFQLQHNQYDSTCRNEFWETGVLIQGHLDDARQLCDQVIDRIRIHGQIVDFPVVAPTYCEAAIQFSSRIHSLADIPLGDHRGDEDWLGLFHLRSEWLITSGTLTSDVLDTIEKLEAYCKAEISSACLRSISLPTGPAIPKSHVPHDGPIDPKSLLFNGKTVDLENVPFRLLKFMWDKPDSKGIPLQSVIDYVWGHDESVSATSVANAQRKVNKALLEVGVPWSLSTKSEFMLKS